MVKNNILLDDYSEEDNLSDIRYDKQLNFNISELISEMHEDNGPTIQLSVKEDDNKEKKVYLNLELNLNESNETIKIDLEISKKYYLELASELID
jgi:hypothetical protein